MHATAASAVSDTFKRYMNCLYATIISIIAQILIGGGKEMSIKEIIDKEKLKLETLVIISRLEGLRAEMDTIAQPFDNQLASLMQSVTGLAERQELWEDFIRGKMVDYQLVAVVGKELMIEAHISQGIDPDWLKEYYFLHPASILKDYVTSKPVISFSPRNRKKRIPFATLGTKWRHNQAIELAKDLVSEGFVSIDTETTGLSDIDQVVSIAVVDKDRSYYTLVKPTVRIGAEAMAIHHITEDMVATAPTLGEVMPFIRERCYGKRLTAYNAPFDRRKIEVSARTRGVPGLDGDWTCSMRLYLKFADLDRGNLEGAATAFAMDLHGSLHNAETDARLACKVIEEISKADPFDIYAPTWDKHIPPEEQKAYAERRIKELLSELHRIQQQEKEAKGLVSAEIKRIEANRDQAIAAVRAEFDNLLGQAKEWVGIIGETVKGQHYQLIYSRRFTWDMPGILEYITNHPDD